MKCNPLRWLWGLFALLPLVLLAIVSQRSAIEADLLARAQANLKSAGMGWASLAIEGRDARLMGKATDDGEPEKAFKIVFDTPGIRTLVSETGLIDKVDKYVWGAVREANRVRLTGFVPNERTRAEALKLVRAGIPGAVVEDNMKLARGAPAGSLWLDGIGFATKQLAHLKQGQVDLEQTAFSVRGEASNHQAFSSVKSALKGGLPKGVQLKQEAVRPPLVKPYVWSARLAGGQLVLGGVLPDDKLMGEVLARAGRSAPKARLDNQMQFGDGAPQGFPEVVLGGLGALADLEEARIEVRDQAVSLVGTTETFAQMEKVKADLKKLIPASFKVTEQIKHRLPKPVSPYVTGIDVGSAGIVISGYVPSEEARQSVLSAVRQRFAGRQVQDKLDLASAQPASWRKCLDAGLAALHRLGNGRLALTDRRLEVAGVAASEALEQSIPADVRASVGSDCDPHVRLTPDPKLVEARQRAEEEARRRAEEEARARAESDARRKAEEEARARGEAARPQQVTAAEAEARRRAGEAEARAKAEAAKQQQLAAAEAEARRRAEDEERRKAAEAEARAKAEAEARARAEAQRKAEAEAQQRAAAARQQQAANCQDALRAAARQGTINFKRASSEIDPKSFATLGRLAEESNRCPNMLIEIEGHTDSDGTPERNKSLSERRAQSVLDYLVKAGVDAGRLRAVGYGETQPVASNDTAENKARNRRIEFTVK